MSLESRIASAVFGLISALFNILTPATLIFLFIEMVRYERDVFRVEESQVEAISFIIGAIAGCIIKSLSMM